MLAGSVTVSSGAGDQAVARVGGGVERAVTTKAHAGAAVASHKLVAALDASAADGLGVDPPAMRGRRRLHGGFTECCSPGAEVVAVDVGHDQLGSRARQDPRVDVRERRQRARR